MENWLVYGLLIAVFFGTSAIAAKVATSEKSYGVPPGVAVLLMLAGIAIVFIAAFFYLGKFEMPSAGGAAFGVLSGMLWALGFALLYIAISRGADVAKIAPIVGVNILVTVLLGIFVLHEVPNTAEMAKVILGAILIVIGVILVS
ncbi:MAG: EamA family transporter [Candidatus Micrarchaeia archaeon]|jgi:uncharacterized membrane protein